MAEMRLKKCEFYIELFGALFALFVYKPLVGQYWVMKKAGTLEIKIKQTAENKI